MNYATILWDNDDGIVRLTLNRPDQMNAFTVEMCDELVDAYARASSDDSVRAIVVTGAGKAFCAGMDLSIDGNVFGLDETIAPPTLSGVRDRWVTPEIDRGVRDTGGKVALAMYDCVKPIVGAVNGVAVGIGIHHVVANGFPHCFGYGAFRLRIRADQDHDGGMFLLVFASHCWPGTGFAMVLPG